MIFLIAFILLFAPAYYIKFNFKGLSLNLLMLWIGIIWFTFIVIQSKNKKWIAFWEFVKNIDRKIFILICLFFLSGVFSLFLPNFSLSKLGQFIVLFFQPITVFFIAGYGWRQTRSSKNFFLSVIYLLIGTMGFYSIIQYLTLFGLPSEYWGNTIEPRRAIGFFSHPNFYSLFSAPLLAFLIADLEIRLNNFKSNWIFVFAWIVGACGMTLSLSRSGWLGLGMAIIIYFLFSSKNKLKKILLCLGVIGTIITISIPNLRWRIILPFYGEKSAVSRLSLWQTGWKGIKESPIFGLGLKGFANNWQRLNADPNLDSHNYPHNIFLNFWLETGLLGLFSFAGLIGLHIYRGLKNRTNPILFGTALFLITFLFQGLLDNPYFKNDLALIFWIILSLAI